MSARRHTALRRRNPWFSVIGVNGVGKTTSVGKAGGKAQAPGEKGRACGSGYLPRSGGRRSCRSGQTAPVWI